MSSVLEDIQATLGNHQSITLPAIRILFTINYCGIDLLPVFERIWQHKTRLQQTEMPSFRIPRNELLETEVGGLQQNTEDITGPLQNVDDDVDASDVTIIPTDKIQPQRFERDIRGKLFYCKATNAVYQVISMDTYGVSAYVVDIVFPDEYGNISPDISQIFTDMSKPMHMNTFSSISMKVCTLSKFHTLDDDTDIVYMLLTPDQDICVLYTPTNIL